jgi:hypothetical protein
LFVFYKNLALKTLVKPGVVAHACTSSTWEAQAGGLGVQGQHGLHRETWLEERKGGRKREKERKTAKPLVIYTFSSDPPGM